MKTHAAVLYQHNKPLVIDELEIPQLGSGQVLVKLAYSGLCHTQVNELRGLKGEDRFLPHTLGHEGSGVVECVGKEITKVKAGDHVVATWIQGMGANVPSAAYKKSDGTTINSGAISTFMARAVISENRLVKIPNEMPMRSAALLGCAIPTGAGIVLNILNGAPVRSIAVFGVGGIGLSAIVASRAKDIQQIIAVDISGKKLEQARSLGATDLIDASTVDAAAEIQRLTGGVGADCVVECAGTRATMEAAFAAVKYGGGSCVIAGNLAQGEKMSIDPMDLIRGKRISGTWGGGTNADRDIPNYAAQYLSGKLKFDSLITHEYPLDDINRACADLEARRVGRAMIRMD